MYLTDVVVEVLQNIIKDSEILKLDKENPGMLRSYTSKIYISATNI